MKTFLKWLVLLPVGIVLLIFAIVNRHPVTLSFDPFEAASTKLQITAPLFIVMFAALAIGIVVGGCVTWMLQGRHRRAASRSRAEAARLQAQIGQLQAEATRNVQPANRALANRNAA